MENNAPPSAWSLVKIPAVITLLVTVLRLVGELQGWNANFFGNIAPGEEFTPGWVGISWLMPIFGFWFGLRLRRATGQPTHVGKSAITYGIATAVMIGGIIGLQELGLMTTPSVEQPGEPEGLVYGLAVVGITFVVAMFAWFRLGVVLLLYAILARIPVLVVTYLGIQNDWDTHYTKLPVGFPPKEGNELFFYLAMPQCTFWIIATIVSGGLFGCLAAAMTTPRTKLG